MTKYIHNKNNDYFRLIIDRFKVIIIIQNVKYEN